MQGSPRDSRRAAAQGQSPLCGMEPTTLRPPGGCIWREMRGCKSCSECDAAPRPSVTRAAPRDTRSLTGLLHIDPTRTQRDPDPALSEKIGVPAIGPGQRNNVHRIKLSKRRGGECSNSGNSGTTRHTTFETFSRWHFHFADVARANPLVNSPGFV
jgi:hypothetical protein